MMHGAYNVKLSNLSLLQALSFFFTVYANIQAHFFSVSVYAFVIDPRRQSI